MPPDQHDGPSTMSNLALGFLSFPVLLLLIFLRAPIGLAMLGVGIGGLWLALGQDPALPTQRALAATPAPTHGPAGARGAQPQKARATQTRAPLP